MTVEVKSVPKHPPGYIVGVDLGQARDYTAICVLEYTDRQTGRSRQRRVGNWATGGASDLVPETEHVYQVRHLERLPLGTPYPEQAERVAAVINRVKALQREQHVWPQPEPKAPRLVADQTGVGRPVVDMLRALDLRGLYAVTIHGGDGVSRTGREYRIPKRELVSVLQVLLQTDRLSVAKALPEADTLVREMLAFKVKISDKGHDSYGNDWRENDHDDLVLAVALAAWVGERIPYTRYKR